MANSPTMPGEPIAFTDIPRLTLMFHVWPHGDSWRRHIEKLEPVLHRFDRLLLGVATDPYLQQRWKKRQRRSAIAGKLRTS
jgi:hypothetical protein